MLPIFRLCFIIILFDVGLREVLVSQNTKLVFWLNLSMTIKLKTQFFQSANVLV